MAMDFDRLDADESGLIEINEWEDYADEHNDIVAVLDEDLDSDEHLELTTLGGDRVEEDIWFDSAPPQHFTIETGYF